MFAERRSPFQVGLTFPGSVAMVPAAFWGGNYLCGSGLGTRSIGQGTGMPRPGCWRGEIKEMSPSMKQMLFLGSGVLLGLAGCQSSNPTGKIAGNPQPGSGTARTNAPSNSQNGVMNANAPMSPSFPAPGPGSGISPASGLGNSPQPAATTSNGRFSSNTALPPGYN